jgi:hypothetical protein
MWSRMRRAEARDSVAAHRLAGQHGGPPPRMLATPASRLGTGHLPLSSALVPSAAAVAGRLGPAPPPPAAHAPVHPRVPEHEARRLEVVAPA